MKRMSLGSIDTRGMGNSAGSDFNDCIDNIGDIVMEMETVNEPIADNSLDNNRLGGFLKKFSLFRPNKKPSSSSIEEDAEETCDKNRWIPNVPVNPSDPLAIKRRVNRRVSFGGIPTEHVNTPGPGNKELADDRPTNRLIDTSTGSGSEGHVNENYESEQSKSKDYFVTAFGEKGNGVGDFQDAKDVTLLPHGRLLISDLVNSRLQLCNSSGRALSVFSGDDISEPWATAVTKDNYIIVTSCKQRCVRILNVDGDIIKTFGEQFFMCPTGIAVDKEGQIIVCDAATDKVSFHDPNGQFIRYIGNSEIKMEQFSKPRYVCVSITGDIIVSDSGNHNVKVFDSKGHFKRSFGGFGRDQKKFKYPYGVCTNNLGDIFVADHYNNRITMFTRDGVFIRDIVTAEQGLVHPQGIAISSDLHLYVTHGHLKANEILIFKLEMSFKSENLDCIVHV